MKGERGNGYDNKHLFQENKKSTEGNRPKDQKELRSRFACPGSFPWPFSKSGSGILKRK